MNLVYLDTQKQPLLVEITTSSSWIVEQKLPVIGTTLWSSSSGAFLLIPAIPTVADLLVAADLLVLAVVNLPILADLLAAAVFCTAALAAIVAFSPSSSFLFISSSLSLPVLPSTLAYQFLSGFSSISGFPSPSLAY